MKLKRAIICFILILTSANLIAWKPEAKIPGFKAQIIATLRKQIMAEAAWAMQQQPETVTARV